MRSLLRSRFCGRCDRAVTRWHHRRCQHYAIVLTDVISAEVTAAGSQLYEAAKVAYDLSRQDKLISYGQRDTMFYALQRWQRATFRKEADDG